MIVTRYALALKDGLNIGTLRLVLANAMLAHGAGGRFQLRLKDGDSPVGDDDKSVTSDLSWLGLKWDDVLRESECRRSHEAATETLMTGGRLYPCFESEEELLVKHELRIRRNQPQIYDRAMLALTAEQRSVAEAGGKRPHWRFKLSDREVTWRDQVLGRKRLSLASMSDPVVIAADGRIDPSLIACIDDLATDVSHVIASEDQLKTSVIQMDMLTALGGNPGSIAFAHLPPLHTADSGRLARRFHTTTLRQFRNDGVEAAALLSYLATVGTTIEAEPKAYEALASAFDLKRIAAGSAPVEIGALLALNRQILQSLNFEAVQERLPSGATAAFWNAIRGNLDLMAEARGYWDVVAGTIVPPVIEGERAFLRTALRELPAEPWSDLVFPQWTEALRAETGRDGSSMLLPLRLALTGEEHGPDLTSLLPLIGRARAIQRLEIAAN